MAMVQLLISQPIVERRKSVYNANVDEATAGTRANEMNEGR